MSNRFAVLIFLSLLAASAWAKDGADGQPLVPNQNEGSICFVTYAPKIMDDAMEHRAFLVIDGDRRVPLLGVQPRIIAGHLDLQKKHRIELVEGGKVWDAWTFRFKSNKPMMNFWRSAGYWHVEPNTSGTCEGLSK